MCVAPTDAMAEASIYLFKTARRARYREENLRILAAERGTVVEVSYNRSWVAPDFFDAGAIRRGTQASFVYTERPYDGFVPVRGGEVVGTRWDGLGLRIQVLLKNPVGLKEVDLPTYTSMVKHSVDEKLLRGSSQGAGAGAGGTQALSWTGPPALYG